MKMENISFVHKIGIFFAGVLVAGSTLTAGVLGVTGLVFGAGLTATDILLSSLETSTSVTVTASFTTVGDIPVDGKIKITFPAGFDVSGATSGTCSSMDGAFATSVSGQTVTIARQGDGTPQSADAETCTIDAVINPSSAGDAGVYGIETTDVTDVQIDADASVAGDTIAIPALTSTNVEPSSLIAGATSTVTVTFTTGDALPANGKIRVVFPSGFDVSSAMSGTCSSMDGTFATSVSSQTVTMTRQNDGTEEVAGDESCTIEGVINPVIGGTTGTYTIATLTAADAFINMDASVAGDTITPATLTSTDVQPASLIQSTTNTVTVSFTTVNSVEDNGKIKVVFPLGFTVSGATNGACSSMDGAFATSVSGQTVTIARSGGSAADPGAHTCTIDSITNPASTGSTGTYTIQTTNNGNQFHDVDSGVAADTIISAATALTSTNVQPASLVAGATGQVTIQFTTMTTIPPGGKIRVTFPSGFTVSGAANGTCATMDGTFTTSISGQTVSLVRQNDGTGQTSGAETCTIDNVGNPKIAGSTGAYTIQTTTSLNAVLDSDASVSADTLLAATLASTNVEPTALTTGSIGVVTITFTTVNILESDGKIKVTFPSGFGVSNATSGTCEAMDGAFATSVSGQTVTITRSGGTQEPAGAQTCTIAGVRNPAVAGESGVYAVRTTTALNAVHDEDTAISSDVFTPASLTNVDVQPASTRAGATGLVTVSFTTVNDLESTDDISVVFPDRFDVSGATSGTCATMDGAFATSVNGQTVTITRSGGTQEPAGAQTCTLLGIKNPSIAGSTGEYAITTAVGGGGIRDRNTMVMEDTITAADLERANVEPFIKRAGAVSSVQISFTTANILENDGKIKVTFPSGFNVANATSGTCSSMDGAFATSVSDQTVTITRSGGSEEPAGAQTCTLANVAVPLVVGLGGLYTITTSNGSGALHDVDTAIAGDVFSASAKNTEQGGSANLTYNVQVVGPQGGEVFVAGDRVPIIWNTNGSTIAPSYVNVWYSTDGGTFWTEIIPNTANDKEYIWTAPDVHTSRALIKIEASDLESVLATDTSEAFTLGAGDELSADAEDISTEQEDDMNDENATEDEANTEQGLTIGSFVRSEESPDVYYIEENNIKRRFPDTQTFFTYAASFDEVQRVSSDILRTYTEGELMTPKEGSVLVKVPTDIKVYALDGVGALLRLRWVASEAVATAVYGQNWADHVIDLFSNVFERIPRGADITSVSDAPERAAELLRTREDINSH